MFTCCRFVNDVLHIRESGQDLFGRAPVEGTDREIVINTFSDSKLSLEVFK